MNNGSMQNEQQGSEGMHHNMHRRGRRHNMHMRHRMGMGEMKMLCKLDLTSSQRDDIRNMMHQSSQQAHAAMRSLMHERDAFMSATPGSSDYQRATQNLENAGEKTARMLVANHAARRAKIYQELTPQQRTKLASLLAKRKMHMQQRRNRHMQHTNHMQNNMNMNHMNRMNRRSGMPAASGSSAAPASASNRGGSVRSSDSSSAAINAAASNAAAPTSRAGMPASASTSGRPLSL